MTASTRKPRILQIVKGLDIGSTHGGAERFALELAGELKRKGLEVSVCAFFRLGTQAEKKWQDRLAGAGIPCFSVADWSGSNDFRSYLDGVKGLRSILQKNPVDICHSHFQLGTIAALGMKAAGLTRRVVRTCHVTQEWETGWYGWIREQIFSKWVFPLYVDAEVGVSKEIVDRLSAYPGARLFSHLPLQIGNAIPPESWAKAEPKKAARIPGIGKVIGSVGRLSAVKGYPYLLEAGRIVRETLPDLQVWLIGDGELRQDLETQADQLGMRGCVRFFGQREDAVALLAQMDLFVLTSFREGLPTVILESFAQEVPVVATDVVGIRELVRPGETGWLVPPADAQALAAAILNALQDETSRAKFRQAGREAAKQFTIETIGAKYAALYDRLMA